MKTMTAQGAFFLLPVLICAGLRVSQTLAEAQQMQNTAEEFRQKLSLPSEARAGIQLSPTMKLRGVGKILSDRSTPAAVPVAIVDYHSIADRKYLELTQDQPKAQASIQFEYDSANIRDASHRVLDELAKALQRTLADAVLIVAGHTDSQGPAGYNWFLSQGRAQAVKDYLVSRGVSPTRLIVRGYGEDYPIDTNETEDGRAVNRRSEFIRIGNL